MFLSTSYLIINVFYRNGILRIVEDKAIKAIAILNNHFFVWLVANQVLWFLIIILFLLPYSFKSNISPEEVLIPLQECFLLYRSTVFLSSQGAWLPANWIHSWTKSLVCFPSKSFSSCCWVFLSSWDLWMDRHSSRPACGYGRKWQKEEKLGLFLYFDR